MIIKKRYVYIDTPQTINEKKIEKSSENNLKILEEQKRIIEEAKRKADEIINQAKQKASEIIEIAKQKSENIKKEAIKEKEELITTQKQSIENMVKTLNERINFLAKKFEETIDKTTKKIENDLLEITKIIVTKLLEKEIDEETTKRKLNKILTHIIGMKKIKLYINPDDLKLLDEDILSNLRNKGIEIIEDSNVQYGVVAETEMGNINTDLKFQMKLINEIIDEVLKNG
ncbi:flagellar export/assembly protein [Thermosipho melanesiensis]|uniref:Flagellar assembly protein FliH/Type III secretion system HrpE domain-containing protein n=3 Tax=Thermosipho melanesiensis TaxID=46541 RepID=A6LMG8_THEM4|nr:FliH/SctL family protein [Thermosipho melanesiensis]ABR31119.1 hypothetical protein Tmel_1270 [Thermosipho melanesiensis BI429]APT74210.1 flagellar export/assembly protein [Thermosipho melanesiensis]OOC36973.1 flagellar export/assembly protein [Thermosipho melanesiensis]OOC37725.1 flagellar export/assembly protein [Thermosipho melanesiensis]OOC40953.1 flagellar export/assembly protein [Thermosipho melanesiensis]